MIEVNQLGEMELGLDVLSVRLLEHIKRMIVRCQPRVIQSS